MKMVSLAVVGGLLAFSPAASALDITQALGNMEGTKLAAIQQSGYPCRLHVLRGPQPLTFVFKTEAPGAITVSSPFAIIGDGGKGDNKFAVLATWSDGVSRLCVQE